MASSLPPEQRSAYAFIIDQILADSDLNTVSAKRIRQGLQDKIGLDLSHQKQAVTALIMERFDKYQNEHVNDLAQAPAPAPVQPPPRVNGTHAPPNDRMGTSPSASHKRKVGQELFGDPDEESDVQVSPLPKKQKKSGSHESDEQMAKRMQAELNRQAARSTRGGGTKRKTVVKSAKKPKKKSAAKINSDDDSDIDDIGDKPEKEKTGAFHKPWTLSAPLQELLGESQLSRPQVVKRIWAYVKERDLQQPDDRRNIICDDALRAVFKADKVHMFTMNKILATQLYPGEES